MNKAQFLIGSVKKKIRRREAVPYDPHHWPICFRKFPPLSLDQWQVNLAKLVEVPYYVFFWWVRAESYCLLTQSIEMHFFPQDMTRLLRRELAQQKQSRGLIPAADWLGELPDKCDRVLFHRRKNRATMKTQKENEVTVLSLKKKKKKKKAWFWVYHIVKDYSVKSSL